MEGWGGSLSSKEALHSALSSACDSPPGPGSRDVHHTQQTLWEEYPMLEFRWISNSFDEHIKVVLYFPVHIIKEQILDIPSLPYNATHAGVLRANTFHQTNPRFSPWRTTGLMTLQSHWLYSDCEKQKLVHCCRFSTYILVISGRSMCRGEGEIFSWAELFS